MRKKVLIVGNYPMVSDSLVQIVCNSEIGLQCLNAALGAKILTFLDKHRVDLIILDAYLPDVLGIEFCKMVKLRNPDQRFLAMISVSQRLGIEKMIDAGINGFILGTAGLNEILTAINTVLSGGFYWGKGVKELLNIKNYEYVNKMALTKREVEILTLISDGLTNQEIAGKLFICCSTVDTHRKNLLLKFNVKNTAKLVKMAVLKGIIN